MKPCTSLSLSMCYVNMNETKEAQSQPDELPFQSDIIAYAHISVPQSSAFANSLQTVKELRRSFRSIIIKVC